MVIINTVVVVIDKVYDRSIYIHFIDLHLDEKNVVDSC